MLDAARIGARAAAREKGKTADQLSDLARSTALQALIDANLRASDYFINVEPATLNAISGSRAAAIKVTVVRDASGRFVILPSRAFSACESSVFFMEGKVAPATLTTHPAC
jgi:hypothetical protein